GHHPIQKMAVVRQPFFFWPRKRCACAYRARTRKAGRASPAGAVRMNPLLHAKGGSWTGSPEATPACGLGGAATVTGCVACKARSARRKRPNISNINALRTRDALRGELT